MQNKSKYILHLIKLFVNGFERNCLYRSWNASCKSHVLMHTVNAVLYGKDGKITWQVDDL